jgi:hypothetical protein
MLFSFATLIKNAWCVPREWSMFTRYWHLVESNYKAYASIFVRNKSVKYIMFCSIVLVCIWTPLTCCCFCVDYHSLHINCGGSRTFIESKTYEKDTDPGGASKFYTSGNWGFSSTGHFRNAPKEDQIYIANNVSTLRMPGNELYMNARLSPISLTYYLRCLANGKYTVRLHFAEIVIRGNRSFYSLGRRIFDVYIQVLNQIGYALWIFQRWFDSIT